MHPLLASHAAPIAALCRRYGVQRLDVFGSASRDDFDETASDVDLVVEFGPEPASRTLEQYLGLKDELETLLGRPVDLVELDAMPGTRLKRLIDGARRKVY
ncbi:MAG: nucleotidyltransferase domain-containing protein [Chromatiales bacterium]|jgi:predicted nucleotidyltransferase|nr:nucleotidyltransferase domain-containing protein [Chromatiales bacterium]